MNCKINTKYKRFEHKRGHTSISKTLHQLGHSGSLLTNGNVDTVQLGLLVGSLVEALLVDDGVNGDSGFSARISTYGKLS